jgi:hypothetical protein
VSQIGHAEEVLRIAVATPRMAVQGRAQSDNKNGGVLDVAKHEARILAHAADLVLIRFEGRFLLLSGAPQLRAEVMRELPNALEQRAGEPFSVEIHTRQSEIAAAAEPAQRIIIGREESATVQRLVDAGPSASARGVQSTLNALREGNVMTPSSSLAHVAATAERSGKRCSPTAECAEARPWSRSKMWRWHRACGGRKDGAGNGVQPAGTTVIGPDWANGCPSTLVMLSCGQPPEPRAAAAGVIGTVGKATLSAPAVLQPRYDRLEQ